LNNATVSNFAAGAAHFYTACQQNKNNEYLINRSCLSQIREIVVYMISLPDTGALRSFHKLCVYYQKIYWSSSSYVLISTTGPATNTNSIALFLSFPFSFHFPPIFLNPVSARIVGCCERSESEFAGAVKRLQQDQSHQQWGQTFKVVKSVIKITNITITQFLCVCVGGGGK
jgi:hypothetical protein